MIRIGKIVASHGLNGAVILAHILNKKNWLRQEDVLFLELNKGSFIPFFVEQVKGNQAEECIVKFEDVANMEQAKKLIGKQVYTEVAVIENQAKDTPLLWIGFTVIDREKGEIGKIEEVFQTAHQWLASVPYEDRTVLIPLIDEMILDLNVRNKFIRMNLPEGLLEL